MLRSLGLRQVGRGSSSARQDPARAAARDAKPGIFSALRYRNYRLFFFGQLVSVTGTFMQGTAQQWLVLTLASGAQAAMALGIVGALQFAPVLLLGPFGGAIADRWPRRNVLVGTQAAAGILAIVLWLLTVTGAVQLWHVFVLAALLGFVNAVDMPTRQAFVSQMVPRDSLLNAVSLNSAQFNASRIVGPGLAGAMIALFGTPLLFLLNGLSYVAVIAGLMMMSSKDLIPVPHVDPMHGLQRLRQMAEGAKFVVSTPAVRTTFIMIAVIGTMGFNFNILLPLEATGVLHAGPAVFGLLTSSLGAGALVGALLLARRSTPPTNRLLVYTGLAFGIAEAGVGLTHSTLVAMVLIAATGFVMSMFSASANTRVQLSSAPELRGRVMSVYMMVFAGTTPFGNLIVSSVASTGGVPLAFAISGIPCLVAALIAGWLWRDSIFGTPAIATPVASPGALPVNEPLRSEVLQPAQSEAMPLAEHTSPASETAQRPLVGQRNARSLPAHMPVRAPGHPIPQPRVADAD